MRAFLLSVLFTLPLAACGGLLGETTVAEQPPTTEEVYATCPGANTASQMLSKAERFLAGRDADKDRLFAEDQKYSQEYRDGIEGPDRWYIALGCTTALLRMSEGTPGAPTKEQRVRAARLSYWAARLMDRPDIGLEATCRGAEVAEDEFKARCKEYRERYQTMTFVNTNPQASTVDADGKEVDPTCEPVILVTESEVIDPGDRNILQMLQRHLDSSPALCKGKTEQLAPVGEYKVNNIPFTLTPETTGATIEIALAPSNPEGPTR